MSQLSAQSIRKLCENVESPMITPFVPEKQVVNGMSYGLSACSYDMRINHGLYLGAREFRLAHTFEDLHIPDNVVAYVCDKSSWARNGVSAFNTLIDPGFKGNLTLELVNHTGHDLSIEKGDPICQITFHWLDEPTVIPYRGKYQNQARRSQPAIYER